MILGTFLIRESISSWIFENQVFSLQNIFEKFTVFLTSVSRCFTPASLFYQHRPHTWYCKTCLYHVTFGHTNHWTNKEVDPDPLRVFQELMSIQWQLEVTSQWLHSAKRTFHSSSPNHSPNSCDHYSPEGMWQQGVRVEDYPTGITLLIAHSGLGSILSFLLHSYLFKGFLLLWVLV